MNEEYRPQKFNSDIIKSVMEEEIHKAFDGKKIDLSQKEEIIGDISSIIINRITTLQGNNFKYITHCLFFTNGDQEFASFSINLWNSKNDGVSVVDYSNEDLRFILTLWGLLC